eukprot:g3416.t1
MTRRRSSKSPARRRRGTAAAAKKEDRWLGLGIVERSSTGSGADVTRFELGEDGFAEAAARGAAGGDAGPAHATPDLTLGALAPAALVAHAGALCVQLEKRLRRTLCTLFLPIGFPDSVSADYFEYQAWDTAQAACSYLRGVLSLAALMKGAGVGAADAAPLAAALQWMLRDGVGMLGGLCFTTLCASSFDEDVKGWRLFADAINNIGLTLDLLAPMAGEAHFSTVAAIAQLCKSMCGVAAGATKAALTQHFALRGNTADVQAKEGSQETAVTLLGMLCGWALARATGDSPAHIWVAFALLTAVHMIANYRAVAALRLPSLNRERAAALADAHLDLDLDEDGDGDGEGDGDGGGRAGRSTAAERASAPPAQWSPAGVAAGERVLGPIVRALTPWTWPWPWRPPRLPFEARGTGVGVAVGVPWRSAFGDAGGAERFRAAHSPPEALRRALPGLDAAAACFAGEHFLLTPAPLQPRARTPAAPGAPRVVSAVLGERAGPRDELVAYYLAHAAARELALPWRAGAATGREGEGEGEDEGEGGGEGEGEGQSGGGAEGGSGEEAQLQLCVNEAVLLHRGAARRWVALLEREGWSVERGLLGAGPFRCRWRED